MLGNVFGALSQKVLLLAPVVYTVTPGELS